jgi:talin
LTLRFILPPRRSSNIGEFSRDMRMLAALEEDASDGDKLLDAARRLAGAFSELLRAAQPGSQEVSEINDPSVI